jgi:hypothetical protein
MQFAASQSDPWDIPAALACKKLQVIWDAIFPDIEYTVTHTSAVYLLVSDPWIDLCYWQFFFTYFTTTRWLMV